MDHKSEPQTRTLLKCLWGHLSARRKRQFITIALLTLLTTLAEIVSLGALIPFLGALASSNNVSDQTLTREFFNWIGYKPGEKTAALLTGTFILAILLAGIFRLLHLKATVAVTFACGSDLSEKLYRAILSQPYINHTKSNSSLAIAAVSKVDVAVNTFSQAVRLISSCTLLISIVIALLYINPIVATTAFAFFGATYLIVNICANNRVRQNSSIISTNKTRSVRLIQNGLGGIRDIILDGTREIFVSLHKKTDKALRNAEASNSIIEGSPRFIMESIGMIFVAGLAYFLSAKFGGVQNALPTLGVLALSAQRMLPALQQAHNAWTAIKGHHASLVEVLELMDSQQEPIFDAGADAISFKDSIELIQVNFSYDSKSKPALSNINIQIKHGSRIGIIGKTGSGKSTLIDVIMGLLQPNSGTFSVDGHPLQQSMLGSWRRNVAHVPQSIFLTDGTIRENIAFGIPENEIDNAKVKSAAENACIMDFVEKLPNGLNTPIGERGIMLSGGERQRIGIARALYKDSELIVLDEATSALDSQTEQRVISSIESMPQRKTMIMVAHRLSTVQNCDTIYVLDQGEIVKHGAANTVLDNIAKRNEMTETEI